MTKFWDPELQNRFAYDYQEVETFIRKVGIDHIHQIENSRRLFEILSSSFDPKEEDGLIREKISAARQRGEKVIVGVGSVGIAGTGPAVLLAAAQIITELTDLHRQVQQFLSKSKLAKLSATLDQALFNLEFLTSLGEVNEAMLDGALDQIEKAISVYAYQSVEEIWKSDSADLVEVQTQIGKFGERLAALVKLVKNCRTELKQAGKRHAAIIFPTQPLTPPPGHGYHLAIMNAGYFPHGVEAGGLEKYLEAAKGRIHATPSREAIKYADHIKVTMRLAIKNLGPGEYYIGFDPLEREIKAMAPFFAENIGRARQEKRPPPSLNIVTTQAPGVSRVILNWLVQAMKEATGKTYLVVDDFYYAYTPANVAPGPRWYRSIVKTPQPIGGDITSALNVADLFYTYIDRGVYIFNSAEGAEMYKCDRNAIDDTNICRSATTARIDHFVGGNFEELKELVHEVAGVGVLGKEPTHLLRRPQIGVGGWCLTKDGHFIGYVLTDESILGKPKDKHEKFQQLVCRNSAKIITESRRLNDLQPYYVAGLLAQGAQRSGIKLDKADILIAGATYLADLGQDTRLSPSFDLISALVHNWTRLVLQPENYRLGKAYLETLPLPARISVVDHSVQYWSEVADRAAVPAIDQLEKLSDGALEKKLSRVSSPRAIKEIIQNKNTLVEVKHRKDLARFWRDALLVDEIAGVFNLTDQGARNYFAEIAKEGILQDYWEAVKGRDILVLAVNHKAINKSLMADLPRLIRLLRGRLIVDTIGLDDEVIGEWLALGGQLVSVRKSPRYLAELKQRVENDRAMAERLFKAVSQGQGNPAEILQEVKVSLYEILRANELGLIERRSVLKDLYLQKPRLNYQTWMALGGKYFLLGKTEAEIAKIRRVFSADVPRSSPKPNPAG